MRSYNKYLIIAIAMVLLFSMSSVCASDLENSTLNSDDAPVIMSDTVDSVTEEPSEEITVENWDDVQYYCSLTDKNYVLVLKENTNYYPSNLTDESYQIQVNNNVTIIGSSGAYFGDASPNARNIQYIAINVPENSGYGITLKNITFKWIATSFMPNGLFLQMAGNANNVIENCQFYNCTLTGGHSSLVYLLRGDVTLTNCSFKNITSDFGCLSLYDPLDNPMQECRNARGEVDNCYFEGNFARSEPGCINNCGVLVVRNSTFYKNNAALWAGAIHTHGGANTTIYDSNFTDNLAGWNGGALYTYSYLQIYNTIFIGNNCTTNNGGGAIGASKYLHSPYIHIEDSLFEDNENLCWGLDELSTTGTGRGGAISLMDDGAITVLNTTFIKNSASIGTAICAIAQGSYGSPNVTIIGNRFINHTRAGDVLDVRVNYNSKCEIRDNYYLANSIEFSKLKLLADERIGDEVTLHVDAALKNPDSYDSDILDKCSYDVYMEGQYLKTVNSKDFTINLKNIEKAQVYVVPSISISKSSEVSVGMPVEYIYVSQNSGGDSNNGSKNAPVKTIAKAIELANATGNIIIMDGTFSEKDLNINYNLTIAGEGNVIFTSKGNIFNIGNVEVSIKNLTFKNCKQASSTSERIIKQSGGTLKLQDCAFESNSYNTLIQSSAPLEAENLKFTKNTGILILADTYTITNSICNGNTATNSRTPNLIKSENGVKAIISDSLFSDNDVLDGCVNFYAKSTLNTLTVTDSTFRNNVANGGCSGIQMPYSGGLLDVKSSLFLNNTDSGKNGAVILTSTEVHVTDSIFLQNAMENTNNALINAKSSANLKKIYCDGNWFGNTQDNYNATPQISPSSNCNYWLFLNVSANPANIFVGESTDVNFDLNNIYNKNGEASYWDSSKLPTVRLSISTTGGKASDSQLTLVYGMAHTVYALQDSEGSLTASFNGFDVVINFTEAKVKPEMAVNASNISVDDDETITIDLPGNATGNLTLTVGNITQTQKIINPKTTFTLSNLPAGDYTAIVTYSGDEYYESTKKSIQFSVNKYNSTTTLSVGQIDVGHDVTLTINVSPAVTGNITLIINNKEETLTLENSKATYTINSITRGDYNVKAIYNGNYKYLTSQDSYEFSVDKLNTTITVNVDDIVYGQDAIIEVTLDNASTGNVTVWINGENTTSEVLNGHAIVNVSDLKVGNKELFVYYGGDNVFNAINFTTSFNVEKASTTLTINVNDIMIGHDETIEVVVESGVSGNITITCDDQSIIKTIPRTGKVTWKLSDLIVGGHEVSAILTSDNYLTVENKTQFKVSDYETPQWPNEGYGIQNTGKSPYDINSNGAILWSYNVSGDVIANMAIDCNGNIYLITSTGVYAIDNGTALWNYNQNNGGNLSGVTIGRDVVIVPESGNTLHFINQTTGERFGKSNIYQGSSLFTPVIDSNANVYISSEYQFSSSDYKLVIVPYSIWERGGNPILISLGNSKPTSAPVIVNENTAVVACSDSLKIIDLNKKQVLSSIKGDNNGIRPVIGSANMIYAVLDDCIVEIAPDGTQIWKTAITGGAGKYLSINDEIGVYTLNSQGNLHVYDLIDGSESVVSNLTFTSSILVGNDGNIYVGSNDAFYAFDSENNILWKTYIGSEVIGSPIVDENGIIYIATGDGLYALSSSELKNTNLTVSAEDIDYGDVAIINIGIDNDATGQIEVKISSKSYNNVSTIYLTGENVLLLISGLNPGLYDVEVGYNGDLRYKKVKSTAQFEVRKIATVINSSASDINVGDAAIINIQVSPAVSGDIVVTVGGIDYNATLNNGFATVNMPNLTSGSYNAIITYLGDDQYESSQNNVSFNVSKISLDINASVDSINYGEDAIVKVNLPSDATGNVSITVDGKTYVNEYVLPGLGVGDYVANISYSGDDKYNPVSASTEFSVRLAPVLIHVVNTTVYYSGELVVVLSDIKGNPISDAELFVYINGNDYDLFTDNKGRIYINLNLSADRYDIVVNFKGNDNYSALSGVRQINMKSTIQANDIVRGYNSGVDFKAIFLNNDGSLLTNASVKFIVNDEVYNVTTNDEGVAILNKKLAVGNYTITIFNPTTGENATQTSTIVKRITNNNDLTMDYLDGSYFKVRIVGDDGNYVEAGQKVTFKIGSKTFYANTNANGYASIKITEVPKTYTVKTTYKGYSVSNKLVVKQVLKAKNVSKKKAKSCKFSATLKTSKGKAIKNKKITFKIKGKKYTAKTNSKGVATITIKLNLKVGKYTITSTYSKTTIKNKLTIKK